MAITINTSGQTLTQNIAADAVMHIASGSDQFDSTVLVAADFVRIVTGFRPKYVLWENMTNGNGVYHLDGMAANTGVRVAATGTRTLPSNGITLREDGFEVTQNNTVPVIALNTLCCWVAMG